MDMSEPFDTSKLKLTKPPGTTEKWDVYEQLCRQDFNQVSKKKLFGKVTVFFAEVRS